MPQGDGLTFLEDLSDPRNSHRPPPACYCPEKMKKADMVVCLGGAPSRNFAAQAQKKPARLDISPLGYGKHSLLGEQPSTC